MYKYDSNFTQVSHLLPGGQNGTLRWRPPLFPFSFAMILIPSGNFAPQLSKVASGGPTQCMQTTMYYSKGLWLTRVTTIGFTCARDSFA